MPSPPESDQLAGCRHEVEDCLRILQMGLTVGDRIAVMRRLEHAQMMLRQIEDEMLLSLLD
jgi:hypothetical protein